MRFVSVYALLIIKCPGSVCRAASRAHVYVTLLIHHPLLTA